MKLAITIALTVLVSGCTVEPTATEDDGGKADLSSIGLELVELTFADAPTGALAAALASLKTVVRETDLTPIASAGSSPTSVGVGGTGSFTRGAMAAVEGNALGSGWKVQLNLDVDTTLRVQLVMEPAQRDRFLADRSVVPSGTRWTVNQLETVSNTASAQLKIGAELFGVGGNVQFGGNLGVSSGIENPISYVLNENVSLDTFIDVRVGNVAQTLIDRQQPNRTAIYTRLLRNNAAAILAWVNGRAVGNGENCGSYYRPTNDHADLPDIVYPRTAICQESFLCCRRTNLIPGSESGTLRCFPDTPHYQEQDDCTVLGLTR